MIPLLLGPGIYIQYTMRGPGLIPLLLGPEIYIQYTLRGPGMIPSQQGPGRKIHILYNEGALD